MAWEYMDDLDYRYETASQKLGFLNGETVIDLCSGNSRLKGYLNGIFHYLSCDLYDDRADFVMTDVEFVRDVVIECDILTLFGYGGFEIDGNELESSTVLDSMDYVITKFKPKKIVLESIKKYNDRLFEFINHYKYNLVYEGVTEGDSWLTNRNIKIYERKEDCKEKS